MRRASWLLMVMVFLGVLIYLTPTAYAVDMGTILSGETLTGRITNPAQTDSFTFNGETGKEVVISISREGGQLEPKIALYAPDGTLEKSIRPYGPHAEITDYQLLKPGTYTVAVSDGAGDHTGDYSLSFLLIPGPTVSTQDTDGGDIGFGETKVGKIDLKADTDAFTFDGEAGKTISINISRKSGQLHPCIFLYAPDGTLGKRSCGANHAVIPEYHLGQTGTYTIVVRDDWGKYTGDYNLSLTIIEEPNNQSPVIDSFTASRTSGNAPLTVDLTCMAHDPDGTIASYKWDFDGDGNVDKTTTDSSVTYTYNNSGTYQAKVTVVDDAGAETTSDPVAITVGPPSLPGDCNGDGTITIDEVQKSINCFLGIENGCCDNCDLNGDGSVTIDEVQKVINVFLGNRS